MAAGQSEVAPGRGAIRTNPRVSLIETAAAVRRSHRIMASRQTGGSARPSPGSGFAKGCVGAQPVEKKAAKRLEQKTATNQWPGFDDHNFTKNQRCYAARIPLRIHHARKTLDKSNSFREVLPAIVTRNSFIETINRTIARLGRTWLQRPGRELE